MLRRLLAALLIAAMAMPVPTVALAAFGTANGAASIKRCAMPEHAALGPKHRCCCDDPSPAASAGQGAEPSVLPAASDHCARAMAAASPASPSRSGCGCELKADPGREPAAPASASVTSPLRATVVDLVRIPASLSTPRRAIRAVHLADPPPAPGLVSRPLLCSWTL